MAPGSNGPGTIVVPGVESTADVATPVEARTDELSITVRVTFAIA